MYITFMHTECLYIIESLCSLQLPGVTRHNSVSLESQLESLKIENSKLKVALASRYMYILYENYSIIYSVYCIQWYIYSGTCVCILCTCICTCSMYTYTYSLYMCMYEHMYIVISSWTPDIHTVYNYNIHYMYATVYMSIVLWNPAWCLYYKITPLYSIWHACI